MDQQIYVSKIKEQEPQNTEDMSQKHELKIFQIQTKFIFKEHSRVRLFRSHLDKKRTSNYSKFELSEYIEKET